MMQTTSARLRRALPRSAASAEPIRSIRHTIRSIGQAIRSIRPLPVVVVVACSAAAKPDPTTELAESMYAPRCAEVVQRYRAAPDSAGFQPPRARTAFMMPSSADLPTRVTVVLRMRVDSSGMVVPGSLVITDGNGAALQAPALRAFTAAAGKLTFIPAQVHGCAIEAPTTITMRRG